MTQCDFQLLLPAYHDRELDASNITRVEQHIRTCPVCAKDLAILREISLGISAAVNATPFNELDAGESARLHTAIRQAADQAGSQPLLRTAGLLSALAASVLIVCGVWFLDLRATTSGSAARPGGASALVVGPEWERVAVTLRADPRPGVAGDSVFYALRYSSTVDWMLDGLIPREHKPWAKQSSF